MYLAIDPREPREVAASWRKEGGWLGEELLKPKGNGESALMLSTVGYGESGRVGVIDERRRRRPADSLATERLATTVSSESPATPNDVDVASPSSQLSSKSTARAKVDVEDTGVTKADEDAEEEEEEGAFVPSSGPCRFRIFLAGSNVSSDARAADRRAALPLLDASAKLVYRSSVGSATKSRMPRTIPVPEVELLDS
ncbi:hypothetical protein BGZ96_008015 [Linnemannia gamsii]|uniref:Uncharacterized protein n=1 Tax=Linnemannia gamsii TaxID=64522 RepID=A0ABQ7KEN5_9FUNG|nr:hypothetical protein BGZ96_008015 [Linnemannia gamsii]